MLKIQEIQELIKLIDQSSLNELEYEEDGCKLKLSKNSQAVQVHAPSPQVVSQPISSAVTQPASMQATEANTAQPIQQEAQAVTSSQNLHKIESPMVGTFYSAPSPDQPDYVKIGDKVKADSIVCIVEAMKLFNEIEAEVNGEIVEILVENGQLVEYGQPLFLVKAV